MVYIQIKRWGIMSEQSDKWAPRVNNPRFLCIKYKIYVNNCTHLSTCGLCKGVKYVEKGSNLCEKTSGRGAKGTNKERTGTVKIDEKQPIKIRKTIKINSKKEIK